MALNTSLIKKYSITLLLLVFTLSLMAQNKTKRKNSDTENQRWHELEFNSVFLLQEILGNVNLEDIGESYQIGYKMGKGNVGLRFGLGLGFSLKSEQESILDERGTTDFKFRTRLGIEWRKKLMERWSLISGLDLIGGTSFIEDVATSSFDVITSRERENIIGGGPLVGVRFWLNPHISFATETAFHAFIIQKVEEVDSQNLPVFDSKTVTFEYPIRFDPPVNLYLIIRF